VVVGAPLGARFIRDKSRLFVAGFLYISIAVQYIAALWIIPQTATSLLFSCTVFAVGTACFWLLARYGQQHIAPRTAV
jgi:positive regulator of sigma E activity